MNTTNTTYTPVKLNSDCNSPRSNADMTTYGFGQTSNDGPGSDVLKSLDTNNQCFDSSNAYILVYADSSSGVCFGDSGGPLVIGDTQFGVTSFVQGGCAAGNPDGFARISTYYSWIQEQVCDKSSDTTNFDCSTSGALKSAVRGGVGAATGGVRSAFRGVAMVLGFGQPLIDPKPFPMYQ